MADEAMNTQTQDTSAIEEPQQETDTNTADNTNQTDGNNAGNSATSGTEGNVNNDETNKTSADVSFLVAKYNKNDVPLTQEQAKDWVQKGMHYHDKLDYLATIKGTTINDLLKKAISDIDNAERSRLEEQFGDDTDTIEKMMKIFHDEQKTKYEKAIADRKLADEEKEKNRISEIGDEFIKLQKDFPELKAVSDLPKEVMKEAANMSLEHAYLKYLYKENKKSAEAIKIQQEAENQSSGSMSSENNSSDNSADEFVKGIWSR